MKSSRSTWRVGGAPAATLTLLELYVARRAARKIFADVGATARPRTRYPVLTGGRRSSAPPEHCVTPAEPAPSEAAVPAARSDRVLPSPQQISRVSHRDVLRKPPAAMPNNGRTLINERRTPATGEQIKVAATRTVSCNSPPLRTFCALLEHDLIERGERARLASVLLSCVRSATAVASCV